MNKITCCFFSIFFLLAIGSATVKAQNAEGVNQGKVWALLWQQKAAEYKALCFQAYNLARLRVDEAAKKNARQTLRYYY